MKKHLRDHRRVFVRPCRTGKNHPPTRIRTRDLRITTQSTVLRSTNWAINGCYIVLQSVLACLLIVSFPFWHKKNHLSDHWDEFLYVRADLVKNIHRPGFEPGTLGPLRSLQSSVLPTELSATAISSCKVFQHVCWFCLFVFDMKKHLRDHRRVFVRPCRTGKNHPPTRIRTRDLRISTQSTVLRSTNWAIGGC